MKQNVNEKQNRFFDITQNNLKVDRRIMAVHFCFLVRYIGEKISEKLCKYQKISIFARIFPCKDDELLRGDCCAKH